MNDLIYKDEKGITNYTCNLLSIKNNKNLIISHKNNKYNLETNLLLPLYRLLSEAQKEKFKDYFIEKYKDTKFKVKLHDIDKKHHGYIFHMENQKEINLANLIEQEIKIFLDNTNKKNPPVYSPEIKKVNSISDITVNYKGNNYKLFLDLLDTGYIKFNKEDKKNIDNVFYEKIKKIIKNKNDIKVTYIGDINYSQKVDIKYLEHGKWKSLKEEMSDLLIPKEIINRDNRKVLKGIVSNVIDGDTIDIYDGFNKTRIRLDNIDAREKQQLGGGMATKYLTQKIYGKEIKVAYREKDKYNRIVATLYIETENPFEKDFNINEDLVRNGMAYNIGYKYRAAAQKAKEENLGIWKYKSVTPDIFRQNEKYYKQKEKEKRDKKHWRNKHEKRNKKLK